MLRTSLTHLYKHQLEGKDLKIKERSHIWRWGQMTSSSFDEIAKGKHLWLFWSWGKYMVMKRNRFLRWDKQKSAVQSMLPECCQKPAAMPVARAPAFATTLAGSPRAISCCSQKQLSPASSPTWCSAAPTPSSLLSLLLHALVVWSGPKRGHKKGTIVHPRAVPQSWFAASSFPPPHLGLWAAQMFNSMPAYVLKYLIAAAGPLRQAVSPQLSLLLPAEGCLLLSCLRTWECGSPPPLRWTAKAFNKVIFLPSPPLFFL